MKKILIIMVAILLLAGGVYADNVTNTVHNLSSLATTNPYYNTTAVDQVCVFCHTPHMASNIGAPLWNRTSINGAAYTMYDNVFSSTIDMTVAGSPLGVSAACLSCHDGTIAFDSLLNEPGSGTDSIAVWTWAGANDRLNNTLSPAALLDTDLTNDHPISITYDTTLDNDFNPANGTNTAVGAVPLYSGRVECGSCHNPHEDIIPMFMRQSNAASALCRTCHIK
jgi:predicted CXXCH cytochrome family protein